MTTLIILVLSAVVIGAVIRMFIAPITGYGSTGTGMATATIIAIVFVILALCWCGGHYNNNVNAAGKYALKHSTDSTVKLVKVASSNTVSAVKQAANKAVDLVTVEKKTIVTNTVYVILGW